jgi:AraC family transcriptional regulator of arabinose operon
MEIHSIGYHHPHDRNFVIDRPDGIGDSWLFLIFKSHTLVRLNGEERIVSPNTFLMYSGDIPEYYAACDDHYVDDWFHFTVEKRDLLLFRELDIPIGKPVHLGDASELSGIIRTMTHEFYTANLYSADLVDLYLKMLFFKLSRQLHSCIQTLPESSTSRYDAMIWLRNRIYNQICTVGSVSEIAQEMSMSISAFQHTYKQIFGVNIMTDIVNARLKHARHLLATTNLPLRQVAEQSGYSSEFHLMRQFKEHEGMTPTQYRKKCR